MKKLPILIIRNKTPRLDDIYMFSNWVSRVAPQPTEIEIDDVETSFDLRWKDFGVRVATGDFADKPQSLWGLDGVKEMIRLHNLVPYGKYKIVIFIYEAPQNPGFTIGNFTYGNDLEGAVFIEVASSAYGDAVNDVYRILTHEFLHACHRLCWWRGWFTWDSMDLYDKEFDVEALDGNRARNIRELMPHWDQIFNMPYRVISFLLGLIGVQVGQISKSLTENKKKEVENSKVSRIKDWASAVQKREGWSVGTRSFRNNNPGNIKTGDADPATPGIQPSSFLRSLGAVAADLDGFVIFPNYQAGFSGLREFLKLCAQRKVRPYHTFDPNNRYHKLMLPNGKAGDELPDLTLIDWANIYAPAEDDNDPNSYAVFVAQQMGVNPSIKIFELL